MTSTNGANIPQAIAAIRNAGWSIRQLAADLGVSRSTVYRWATGTQPREVNFTALRQWVDMTYALEAGKRRLTVASLHFQQAAEALETDAEKAQADALAADINAHRAEGERRRRAQEHMDRIAQTDPLALVGEPQPALPF